MNTRTCIDSDIAMMHCILTAANLAVAFGFGAYNNFLQVLRERPVDFEEDICGGLSQLMKAICGRRFTIDFPLQTALELTGALAGLLAPQKADEIASDMLISLTAGQDASPSDTWLSDSLQALEQFPEDAEDGLVSLQLVSYLDRPGPLLVLSWMGSTDWCPCCAQRFLYWIASSTVHAKQHQDKTARSSSTSRLLVCSCIAKLMSFLSAELDVEGRTPWWPSVSGFVKRHSASGIRMKTAPQPRTGNSALEDTGALESSSEPVQDSAVVEDFKMIVVEVLGGQIPMLREGAAVSLKDGRSGVIVHCCRTDASTIVPVVSTGPANASKVWIALSDGSLSECESKSVYLASPFTGRLGPESLRLLLPYIRPIKEHLFKAQASCASARAPGTGNSVDGHVTPSIYFRLCLLKVPLNFSI
jgi:hypothetical protein